MTIGAWRVLNAARRITGWLITGKLGCRLRSALRVRRAARQLAGSGFFDRAWYLQQYRDVAAAGVQPTWHYVARGAAEGRNPGPNFDGDSYLTAHPEVAIAGENPLVHYLTCGRRRGFAIAPAAPKLPRLTLTDASYSAWIKTYDTISDTDAVAIRAAIAALPSHPVFALSLDEFSPATIASVQGQLYPHWRVLESACAPAGRASNAQPEFLLSLPPGVSMARTALFEFAWAVAQHPNSDLLYADEDRIDDRGRRYAPWFKPDFDPELALAPEMMGRLVYRFAARRLGVEGLPDASRIRHVPAVLFHVSDNARPDSDLHSVVATRVAAPMPANPPLVSIIVPTRDRPSLLERCVDGVLRRTAYPCIELIIADNDSCERRSRRLFSRLASDPRVRILPSPGAFNWSAINNRAVEIARGEVIVLLNNDVEVIESEWLQAMVALLLRPGVGVVGAKRLYPSGAIQHAGIALGPAGMASHLWRGAPRNEPGYYGDLLYPHSVTAVTGACLAIHRWLYREVGGLDEEELPIAHNDIDLCLRVRAHGYRVVWTPGAVLLHREAATRGEDETSAQRAQAATERAVLVRRWGELVDRDPVLNPNLVVVRERLALASPPARPRPWLLQRFHPDCAG